MKSKLTRRKFVATSTLAAAPRSTPTAGFESKWRGNRVWIGPQYWANPLQDWRIEGDTVVVRAGENRTLHLLTHQTDTSIGGWWMSVRVTTPAGAGPDTSAGFRFGVRGLIEDYRHALVLYKQWVDAVVRVDGRLILDGETSAHTVPVTQAITLELRVENGAAELRATAGGKTASVTKRLVGSRFRGNIALVATARSEGGQRKRNRAKAATQSQQKDGWPIVYTLEKHNLELCIIP